MPDRSLAIPTPLPPVWLDPQILAGQLAPASLTGYQRDLVAYLRFCPCPGTLG